MAGFDKSEDDAMLVSVDSLNRASSSQQPQLQMNFSIQREDTMMFADCLDDDYGEEDFENLDQAQEDNFEQRFKQSIENKPQENIKSDEYIDT